MELRLHNIIDHLYNIFLENDGSENCAQLLEEEVNKMFGTKYLMMSMIVIRPFCFMFSYYYL